MIAYPFPIEFDRARYAPAYLRLGLSEADVQAACIQRLEVLWRARVTVVDSGDRRLRGSAARLGLNLRDFGGTMEAGISDLAVTFPGGLAGWFEVKKPACYAVSRKTGALIQKRPAGAPTREQLDFLLGQHRVGAVVGVLWSARDLDSLIPTGSPA